MSSQGRTSPPNREFVEMTALVFKKLSVWSSQLVGEMNVGFCNINLELTRHKG